MTKQETAKLRLREIASQVADGGLYGEGDDLDIDSLEDDLNELIATLDPLGDGGDER